jgi:hypothetical protein
MISAPEVHKMYKAEKREGFLSLYDKQGVFFLPFNAVVAPTGDSVDDHIFGIWLSWDSVGPVKVEELQDGPRLILRGLRKGVIGDEFDFAQYLQARWDYIQVFHEPLAVVQTEGAYRVNNHPRHQEQAGVQMNSTHESIHV